MCEYYVRFSVKEKERKKEREKERKREREKERKRKTKKKRNEKIIKTCKSTKYIQLGFSMGQANQRERPRMRKCEYKEGRAVEREIEKQKQREGVKEKNLT